MALNRLERLADMPAEYRADLAALLDQYTVPMTRREIEKALAPVLTRREMLFLPRLLELDIVALRHRPDGDAGE